MKYLDSFYIKRDFTFLGIDESKLGIGSDSSIVVAAETKNPELCRSYGCGNLRKSKHYLLEAFARQEYKKEGGEVDFPEFPTLDDMKEQGLETFHWMRATGGRFPVNLLQHASIAHLVTSNGYNPKRTILIIDGFYSNRYKSQYIIREYLKAHGFNVPKGHIDVWTSADESIPIVNMADLLAFQIGLDMNERYREYFPDRKNFPIEPTEIPFDERRVVEVIPNRGRKRLEEILDNCNY